MKKPLIQDGGDGMDKPSIEQVEWDTQMVTITLNNNDGFNLYLEGPFIVVSLKGTRPREYSVFGVLPGTGDLNKDEVHRCKIPRHFFHTQIIRLFFKDSSLIAMDAPHIASER